MVGSPVSLQTGDRPFSPELSAESVSFYPPFLDSAYSQPMKFRQILQQYWGYPDFRGVQRQIIESIASGRDTLGLMPTGGGKSITFQVPTLAMEGLCLVVTPLIALMKDQVLNLKQRGLRAAAIYSGMSREQIGLTLDNAVLGAYKFLYVSPERLSTSLFLTKVQRMKVALITVDEAHCISQWGYDFRPEYLRIAAIREVLPGVPVLALTATATSAVVTDIQRQLGFAEPCVFKMSFARDNLHYIVRQSGQKEEEMLHILRSVPGSAIVYTRSRRGTREVAQLLASEGISASYYHAGLTPLDKDVRQKAWVSDQIRVMVATNAFGMGIDKPDVRLVIHLDVPDSVEAYFQEAGRGGRDGKVSYAVLLYDRNDAMKLRTRVPQNFPERDYIRKVYSDLSSYYQIAEGEAEGRTFDFDINHFCRTFHHSSIYLVSALQLLTRAGYIYFRLEDDHTSRMMFLLQRHELYDVDYLSETEERVMYALMRREGGFFADYVALEEDRVAEDCDMTPQQVYQILLKLNRQRIINYVPRKNCPQITYTTRRVDTDYITISKEIYEQRRDQYKQRIESMIGYFDRDDECRSRYLLHYFDDEAPDCGYCDVCISREREPQLPPHEAERQQVQSHIEQVLCDGQYHLLDELVPAGTDRTVAYAVIEQLHADELLEIKDNTVRWIAERGADGSPE